MAPRPKIAQHTVRDSALILRTFPFREADLIVRTFTHSHGKLSLLARGARNAQKRKAASLDALDRGTVEVALGRSSLHHLQAFTHERSFKRLREDLDKLSLAAVVCDAVDILFKEESVEAADTFELISLTLESIDAATELTEALRALHLGLSGLLVHTGHLDPAKTPSSSPNGLAQLMLAIEGASERELSTRALAEETIERFKKNRSKMQASEIL